MKQTRVQVAQVISPPMETSALPILTHRQDDMLVHEQALKRQAASAS